MNLLFESRTNIGVLTGKINFFQRQPYIHPEPVIRPDSPGDGRGVASYGSVHNDGGKLRMWYYATPQIDHHQGDDAYVAYAESADGIHWHKPALNILKDLPAGNNLTNFGMHSASLFIDPDSPPSHRYRGLGTGNPNYQGSNWQVERRGYYSLHSSDGLNWQLDAPTPRWLSSDVISSIYHPGRRAGLIAMKYTPLRMRMLRRSIHLAEFRDGEYGDESKALYPDEFDDISANTRGFHSCDYYGMGMMPAGMGTVGFVWKYWHELPYTSRPENVGNKALYGRSDISLVYQERPGDCWLHLPGRPVFIDHTALPWTRGWIYSTSNVVEVGDEQRLYFSGRAYPHGYGLDENWQLTEERDRTLEGSGITFASWPKNRLFGFEALPGGTFYLHLGCIKRPSRLFLNYETFQPDGHIRAELVGDNIETRTFEQSTPLTGDQLSAEVSWESGTVIPASPAARVKLDLRFARIYAYELRPA